MATIAAPGAGTARGVRPQIRPEDRVTSTQSNTGRPFRVGLISYAPLAPDRLALVKRRFASIGYREGDNIEFEARSSNRDKDATAVHARELLDLDLDVIWGMNTNATVALRAEMGGRRTPVVFWATDPVESGIVDDLRATGSFTGFAAPVDLQVRQLRFVHATFPGLERIPLLYNSTYGPAPSSMRNLQQEAELYGKRVDVHEVRSLPEIEPVLARIQAAQGKAFLVSPHALFNTNGGLIGRLAREHRLGAVAVQESIVRGGGLVSFFPSGRHIQDGILSMIDRILQGTPAEQIPIDRKIAFTEVINNGTAAQLGVQVPAFLLEEADEVMP